MKKLIALMLAVLLCALCAGGIAEGTDASEETAFVQIKEGVTAEVFTKPGDENATDSLAGGQLCGLIDETKEAGIDWFLVFYLNAQKKGTTGYINAEDAKKLTGEELKALMEDPATLNEILDLIDALDDYLSTGSTATTTTNKTGTEKKESGITAENGGFKAFYDRAMKELKALFSRNLTAGANAVSATGKDLVGKTIDAASDIAGKATDAVKDLAGQVTDTAENIADQATDTVAEIAVKAIDAGADIAGKAIDAGTDIAETAVEAVSEKLDKDPEAMKEEIKEIVAEGEEKIGDLADGMTKAADKMQDGITKDEIQELIDSVNKAVGLQDSKIDMVATLEKMEDALKDINKTLGQETGKAIDNADNAMNNTKKWFDSNKFTKLNSAVEELSKKFKDEGFWKGTGGTGDFINSIRDAIKK
jgi:hypothetical protein